MYSITDVIQIHKGQKARQDAESRRSWRRLWYDVTQETTFHGVRFITEKRSYVLRRLIWALMVLGSLAMFANIVAMRTFYYMSGPKAVNVEVVYAPALDFPTVTICNQNFFRASETFKMGLFDEVDDSFRVDNSISTGSCTGGEFEKVEGQYISLNPYPVSWSHILDFGYIAYYHQVTLRVCKHVCVAYHAALCNSFMYLVANRTCYISSLSLRVQPHQVDVQDAPQYYVYNNTNLDTYVRKRCPVNIKCDFETTSCEFYSDGESLQPWRRHTGATSTPGTGPTRDHTKVYGHYFYVDSPQVSGSSKPNYTSPYIEAEAEPVCVRFAYSLQGHKDQLGTIALVLRTTLGGNATLWFTNARTSKEWDQVTVHLGTGLFQISFVVTPGSGNLGDVAIDDMEVKKCSEFVQECQTTVLGTEYMGLQNNAVNGSQCVHWSLTPHATPMLHDADANHAYCRNPDDDASGTWCYVNETGGVLTKRYCDIPMCECGSSEYTCGDGVCLHHLMVCDGITDCADGQDEKSGCVKSVGCDFEDINSCGYNLDLLELAAQGKASWLRYKGRIRNGNLRTDHTHGTKQGHYLYFDSGAISLLHKERVALLTPMVTNDSSSSFCLSLQLYNRRNAHFPDRMSTFNLYRYYGRYQYDKVGTYEGSDASSWTQHLVALPNNTREYYLMMEVTPGTPFYGDIAVDDVQLLPWSKCLRTYKCAGRSIANSNKCDGTYHCNDLYDEGEDVCGHLWSITCAFSDAYSCGYKDDSNPDVDGFKPTREFSRVDGRFVQHYPRKIKSGKVKIEAVKRLVSPVVSSHNQSCFGLTYNINPTSDYYCLLYVYQEQVNSRNQLKTLGASSLGEGTTARISHVTLSGLDLYQVALEAKCARDDDVITVSVQETKVVADGITCISHFNSFAFYCDFTGAKTCGYLDVSTSEIVWENTNSGYKASVPLISTVSNGQSRLLSPTLTTTARETCVYVEVFRGAYDISFPTLTVKDYHTDFEHKEKTLMSEETTIELKLNAGDHRLLFIADVPKGTFARIFEIQERKCPTMNEIDWDMKPNEYKEVNVDNNPHYNEMNKKIIIPAPAKIVDPEDLVYMRGDDTLTVKEPPPDLPTYYRRAGHQIKDMLHSCTWAGVPCGVENFTSEITDYGFCHTFNSGLESIRKTSSTGSLAGLRLMLNIEQYDYMRGPQTNAGVKVFLHDPQEVPQVRDLGFSTGPGQHALVAVTLSKSESLPKPWGTCGDQPLEYGGNYTFSRCVRECETSNMLHQCDCRDAYMPPHNQDVAKVCSVERYLNCALPLASTFGEKQDDCVCNEPCNRTLYHTQMSYGELSSISVDQILSTRVQQLNQSHLAVQEINQRVNAEQMSSDLEKLHKVKTSYKHLLNFALNRGWSPSMSILPKIDEALSVLLTDVVAKDHSTFMTATIDTYLNTFNTEYGPIRETVNSYSTSVQRDVEVLLRVLDTYIRSSVIHEDEVEIIPRLIADIFILISSLGTYQYAFSQLVSVYANTISSKDAMDTANLPSYPYVNYPSCASDVSNVQSIMSSSLEPLLTYIEDEFTSNTPNTNTQQRYLNTLFSVNKQLQTALSTTQTCLDNYHKTLTDLGATMVSTLASLTNAIDSLPLVRSGSTVDDLLDYYDETDPLMEHQTLIDSIVLRYSQGQIGKLEVIQEFSTDKVTAALQRLSLFKSHIVSQLIETSKARMKQVKAAAISVYTTALKDQLTLNTFFSGKELAVQDFRLWLRPKGNAEDPQNPSYATDKYKIGDLQDLVDVYLYKVLSELMDWYMLPLTTELDKFERDLTTYITDVETAINSMGTVAMQFQELTAIGPDFVRKNFLALDIFFAQLKYQKTAQIRAYDEESLFGDIGGFMGLLLGGSVMSLFEFVDLIVYNCFRKYGQSKDEKEKKKKQENKQDTWADKVPVKVPINNSFAIDFNVTSTKA